jgi:hypothetical protein
VGVRETLEAFEVRDLRQMVLDEWWFKLLVDLVDFGAGVSIDSGTRKMGQGEETGGE